MSKCRSISTPTVAESGKAVSPSGRADQKNADTINDEQFSY
jgi:hypothetical protein